MNPSQENSDIDSKPDDAPAEVSAVSAPPATPGATLRAAREALKLTPAQLASETNISVRYIHALENDDYATLPGIAFARGYVRGLAHLLKLDANGMVASFDALWSEKGLNGAVSKPAAAPVRTSPATTHAGNPGFGHLKAIERKSIAAQVLTWGSLLLLLLLIVGSMFWKSNSVNEATSASNDSVSLDVDNPAAATSDFPAPVLTNDATPSTPAAVVAPAPVAALPAAAVVAPAAGSAATATAPVAPATTPAATAPATPVGITPAGSVPAAASAPSTAAAASKPVVKPVPAKTGTVVLPINPSAAGTASQSGQPLTPVIQNGTSAHAAATAQPGGAVVIPVISESNKAPADARIDSLSFSFTGKSWISVRDSTGQELVYGLKNTGQVVTVTGQAPFSINIGNVKVTTLSRNGEAVSLKPYARGEIASFRLAR